MTLECDHRFGMDVMGDVNNVRVFRFACSAAISPLEYSVMNSLFPNSSLLSSITTGLGCRMLNGTIPTIYISNGYLIINATYNEFIVIDPITGIVRDVGMRSIGSVHDAYCYSDQQTDWSSDLGEELCSNNGTVSMEEMKPVWLGLISTAAISAAEGGSATAVGGTAGVLELSAVGTVMVEGGAFIGMSVAVAVLLYEPYFMLYEFPEKLRIMKEIYDMKKKSKRNMDRGSIPIPTKRPRTNTRRTPKSAHKGCFLTDGYV